jgi:plasmid maintenance system antidote protein VapI
VPWPASSACRRIALPQSSLATAASPTNTAILLGERFGTSAEFWLNLQMMHELEEARQHMRRRAA